MSWCVSRDTDSLECTVYLHVRKKWVKGTGQEKTRRKRGVEKEKKKNGTAYSDGRTKESLFKKMNICAHVCMKTHTDG